ncbi:hypothetical protein NIES2109_64830 (plasmid) [Nostoc sp. HK-01]|nr:hypothetical protein NIES2109_64830 [Nostoc sp. HK-01]
MSDKSQPDSQFFDTIIAFYPSESLLAMEALTKKLLKLQAISIFTYSDSVLDEQSFTTLFNNMRVMIESKPFNSAMVADFKAYSHTWLKIVSERSNLNNDSLETMVINEVNKLVRKRKIILVSYAAMIMGAIIAFISLTSGNFNNNKNLQLIGVMIGGCLFLSGGAVVMKDEIKFY